MLKRYGWFPIQILFGFGDIWTALLGVVLRQGLEEIIRRLQGSRKHVGKRPSFPTASGEANRVLVTLRRELQEAIQAEDYAQAALLRDQIKNSMQTIQETLP
mgnify:CR=1 FL=1